jgi:hypothetical protein
VSCVGGGAVDTESFFACAIGALVAPGAARVVVEGRVLVVLVEGASDVRGVARAVGASAAGRVVRGRFAPAVVEGASDCLDVVLPGDARVAALGKPGVLRTVVGRLFSSPEVTDDSSGSASDAVAREDTPGLLTAEPGAGRVGGLFRLDPTVLTREVELVSGFDAPEMEALAVLVVDVDAVGLRALAVTPAPAAAVGRRGGTGSLLEEAIIRRTDDAGVEGAGSFLFGVTGTPLALPSLAGGGSMVVSLRGRCRSLMLQLD